MHAELATSPALPRPARLLPHSRDSVSTTVQLAAWTSLVAPTSERASSITCVHVLGPTGLAAAISINRSYGLTICRLPPADAMTDVTQVVLLSVCLELQSECAEPFLNIFCGLSHSVPVKVASRSIPGGETTGQQ